SRRLTSEGEQNERARRSNVGRIERSRAQESATNQSRRGPSLGRVHQWTDARKRPSKLSFLSLFGTPGAATRCRGSIRKSLRAKQIGPVTGVAGRSGSLVRIGAPKRSHRCSLHVHHVELKSRSQIS